MKKLLLIALLIVGCGIFEKEDENTSIVGVWEGYSAYQKVSLNESCEPEDCAHYESWYYGEFSTITWIFGEDGILSIQTSNSSGIHTYIDNWSVTGNKLTIIRDSGENSIYDFSISGNTLTTVTLWDIEDGGVFKEVEGEYKFIVGNYNILGFTFHKQ